MPEQIELPFNKPEPTSPSLQLQTKISAEFIAESPGPQTPEQRKSLDALNQHAEDVCERLQPVFRNLVIEMLELKRRP